MSPRVVIQDEAHDKRRRLIITGAAALALACSWGLYLLGRAHAPGAQETYQITEQRLAGDRKRLVQENRRLKDENRELTARLVALERADDVDAAAESELRQALTDLQAKVEESNKELAFYRGILSPKEAKAGVRVQQLTLQETAKPRTYRFDLVLIQSARHDKRIDGRVQLRIDGLRDNEAISLSWADVALDPKTKIVFSFKYFQELTGTFRVPENFEPTLVEVEIVPRNRGDDAFVERYDWNKLTQADG